MTKTQFENSWTGRKVNRVIASKYISGKFTPVYMLCAEDPELEKVTTKEKYEKLDVPETKNSIAEYQAKLEGIRKSGKFDLPDNWKDMPTEKQCEFIDDLLKAVLDIDEEVYSINTTLQWEKTYARAFVQFSDGEATGVYEPDYVRCNLVRRDPNVTLADLPESFQKWANDFYGEEDAEKETRSIELCGTGSTFTEALEDLFSYMILLFYGYDCCCFRGDYESYCEENDDNDEDDDEDDDEDNY